MGSLQTLTGILGLAVASGINLYASMLMVGLGIRFGLVTGLPDELRILAETWVLAAAGTLYAAEFAADKIPFVTPFWDAIHTFIRPAGAALLALGAAGDLSPTAKIAAVLLGGSLALGAHSTKMGFRLAAHATPEPVTHSAISIAEDFGVLTLLLLVFEYPLIALPILLILIGLLAYLAPRLWRGLRFLIAAVFGRIRSWFQPATSAPPAWLRTETAGAPPVLCYVRSFERLPRFQRGYLVPANEGWNFFCRRYLRTRKLPVAHDVMHPGRRESGVLVDILGSAFYCTKDWSHRL